jgi:hypothetical protein
MTPSSATACAAGADAWTATAPAAAIAAAATAAVASSTRHLGRLIAIVVMSTSAKGTASAAPAPDGPAQRHERNKNPRNTTAGQVSPLPLFRGRLPFDSRTADTEPRDLLATRHPYRSAECALILGALVARKATGLRSLAMTAAATGSHELMGQPQPTGRFPGFGISKRPRNPTFMSPGPDEGHRHLERDMRMRNLQAQCKDREKGTGKHSLPLLMGALA